jgi:hypothetical protein
MKLVRYIVPLVAVALVVVFFRFRAANFSEREGLASSPADNHPGQKPAHAAGGAVVGADGEKIAAPGLNQPASLAAEIDPLDEMFADALKIGEADRRRAALGALAEYLAARDPAKARDCIAFLLNLKNGTAEGDAYVFARTFADRLAARDPRAAIAWTKDLPEGLKDLTYQFVAKRWVVSDPRALSQWVGSIDDPALRATVIRTMSRELLYSDPKGFGAEWAVSLARTEDGPRFSDLVARQWAKSDAGAAWAWASALRDPETGERAMLAIAETMAEADPARIIQWTGNLPVSEFKNRMIQQTVATWAALDPAAAAAWVSAHFSTPGLVDGSVHLIATAWMRKDAVAATAWLEKTPVKQELKDYILATSVGRKN